jgi:hypothetical protein
MAATKKLLPAEEPKAKAQWADVLIRGVRGLRCAECAGVMFTWADLACGDCGNCVRYGARTRPRADPHVEGGSSQLPLSWGASWII